MPLYIMQPLYPCENVLKGKYHLSIKFWLWRPPYTSSTQGTTLKSRVKKTNYTIINLITTARSTMTKHSNWRPSLTVEGIRKASLRSDVLRPFPRTGILTLVLYLPSILIAITLYQTSLFHVMITIYEFKWFLCLQIFPSLQHILYPAARLNFLSLSTR